MALSLHPSMRDVVLARGDAEELRDFDRVEEVRAIAKEYSDRLLNSKSVGYDRLAVLYFWTTCLWGTFSDEWLSGVAHSREYMRTHASRYPVDRGHVRLAMKPYKDLGLSKERVEEDRLKFLAFIDWLEGS
jgi:hypothetical protein